MKTGRYTCNSYGARTGRIPLPPIFEVPPDVAEELKQWHQRNIEYLRKQKEMDGMITDGRQRAIDAVKEQFMKKEAYLGEGLVCNGKEFAIEQDGKSIVATDEEVNAFIDKHLELWATPENGGLEWLGLEDRLRVCPSCGKVGLLHDLSRKDNKTMICHDCGLEEALGEMDF